MKYPHLVVLNDDGWLVKNLRPLCDEHRWLIREPRTAENALAFVREERPGVLIVHLDLAADVPAPFALIADVQGDCPDFPVLAVSDVKVNDADQSAWTAVLADLGARIVLFPPLTRPVVEDAVSGLVAASIRRGIGAGAAK